MVSCIEIETASMVFACVSLFSSCMGTFVCIALMVYINIFVGYLVKTTKTHLDRQNLELGLTYYGLYFNVGLAVTLTCVVISLVFSIILTKGLLSKKAHLVKAYFIYGTTGNSLSALFAIFAIFFYSMPLGLLSLLGCFIYSIILIMIKRTYDKLATTAYDQFCDKNIVMEKPTV